jgi:hypothetical protein
VSRRGPWTPPAWFERPAQRIRFEHDLAAHGVRPRRARPNRQHRGGYQVAVTVVPPGVDPRRVTITFSRVAPETPIVHADGPTDSPHRYDDGGLCMWYPWDPPGARWRRRDGAGALLGQIIAHLVREEWWRRTGEWVGDEVPHRDREPGQDDQPDTSTARGRAPPRTAVGLGR